MNIHSAIGAGLMIAALSAHADNFTALDQAYPANVDISSLYPVFDFDTDGCLPSAGISRTGVQNGGLSPSGSITGGCRSSTFLSTSNTLHRYACVTSSSNTYCGHFFALYFLKDQTTSVGGGHRHDWEYAAVWTTNGVITHGGYSAHGDLSNSAAAEIPFENGHLKFVYHKDGASTHAFRFAKSDETAENPYGVFVTPTIISWHTMTGDTVDNATLRSNLNSYDYGSAVVPLKDSTFLDNLNTYKPSGYPTFTQSSVDSSQ